MVSPAAVFRRHDLCCWPLAIATVCLLLYLTSPASSSDPRPSSAAQHSPGILCNPGWTDGRRGSQKTHAAIWCLWCVCPIPPHKGSGGSVAIKNCPPGRDSLVSSRALNRVSSVVRPSRGSVVPSNDRTGSEGTKISVVSHVKNRFFIVIAAL